MNNNKIEELRQAMYELFKEVESLTDPRIVVISQQLDQLLNDSK